MTGAEPLAGAVFNPPGALRIELSLAPEWGRIEFIRVAVGQALAAVLHPHDDRIDALSMVSAELLENALKYGARDQRAVGFTVERTGDPIAITVENAVDAASPHPDALRVRLAWIARFPSPAQAYLAALRDLYGDERPRGSGGLGMVRIAYEGGCALHCETPAVDRILVRATLAGPAAPRSSGPVPEDPGDAGERLRRVD
ncbi:MAG: ATP-binding protein [Myxococcales bacterium]|nr:ATP-binding protein [Myxococcales bacterium]